MTTRQPVLIFDGDCAVCSTLAHWAETRLAGTTRVIPWQRLPLSEYRLTLADVERQAWWSDSEGHLYGGSHAVGKAFTAFGGWWRVPGFLCLSPPTSWGAAIGYQWVAKFRHRLPGGTPACTVPTENDNK